MTLPHKLVLLYRNSGLLSGSTTEHPTLAEINKDLGEDSIRDMLNAVSLLSMPCKLTSYPFWRF